MNFRDLHEEVSKILDGEEENIPKDFKTEITQLFRKAHFQRNIDLLMSYSGIFPVCCFVDCCLKQFSETMRIFINKSYIKPETILCPQLLCHYLKVTHPT